MAGEIVRPSNFPLSEEEFRAFKEMRLREILSGKYHSTYSEWCLRGGPGEPFNPTVVLAIFPTPALTVEGVTFEQEAFVLGDTQRDVEAYWQDTKSLSLPQRVLALEKHQYRILVDLGDQLLSMMSTMDLPRNVLPSAIVAFSRPNPSAEESAFLICPTLIPPSAAFRHFVAQAQRL